MISRRNRVKGSSAPPLTCGFATCLGKTVRRNPFLRTRFCEPVLGSGVGGVGKTSPEKRFSGGLRKNVFCRTVFEGSGRRVQKRLPKKRFCEPVFANPFYRLAKWGSQNAKVAKAFGGSVHKTAGQRGCDGPEVGLRSRFGGIIA